MLILSIILRLFNNQTNMIEEDYIILDFLLLLGNPKVPHFSEGCKNKKVLISNS